MNRRPTKPTEPMHVLTIGDGARFVVEQTRLPSDRDDLENEVSRRFASGVAGFFPAAVATDSLDEPADSLLTIDDGTVAVQHIEVFDLAKKRADEQRNSFALAIEDRLKSTEPSFRGFRVQLLDGQDVDVWHPSTQQDAALLVTSLVTLILSKKSSLRNLPFTRSIEFDLPSTTISVRVTRNDYSEQEILSVIPEHSWNQRQIDAHQLLLSAVRQKAEKGYSRRPLGRSFWLLAWGTDALWFDNRAFAQAHSYLQTTPHPFDAVWAMTVSSSQQRCVRIWPDPLGWGLKDVEPVSGNEYLAAWDFRDGVDASGRPPRLDSALAPDPLLQGER